MGNRFFEKWHNLNRQRGNSNKLFKSYSKKLRAYYFKEKLVIQYKIFGPKRTKVIILYV
jgi:hypothetical protein